MATPSFQLLADHGFLCTPLDYVKGRDPFLYGLLSRGSSAQVLVCRHESEDYDSVKWPNPVPEHLRAALYDARETGLMPDVPSVLRLTEPTSWLRSLPSKRKRSLRRKISCGRGLHPAPWPAQGRLHQDGLRPRDRRRQGSATRLINHIRATIGFHLSGDSIATEVAALMKSLGISECPH